MREEIARLFKESPSLLMKGEGSERNALQEETLSGQNEAVFFRMEISKEKSEELKSSINSLRADSKSHEDMSVQLTLE